MLRRVSLTPRPRLTATPHLGALALLWLTTAAHAHGQTPPPDHRPSLALVPLAAKTGIAPATAELVTDALVQEVRGNGSFSRVVSASEIQTVLGLEQSRQMLDCSSGSCMAEIGGALNVAYILSGNVGRLGESWLLNLNLVDARSGMGVSSVSFRIKGSTEEALLDSIKPSVAQLLRNAPLGRAATPAGTTATEPGAPKPVPWRGVLLGSGGVALALLVPAAVLGLVLAGVSAFVLQGMWGLLVPITGVPFALKVGTAGGSGVGAALLGVLMLALGAAGVGLLVMGWMQ